MSDIPAMHGVRLAVRGNALSDPGRIADADYLAALDAVGRTGGRGGRRGAEVACATGYRDGSLWALFVDPKREARGYGTALHDLAVDWRCSLGPASLRLTTGPGTRAERFYRTHGWQPAGTGPGGDVRRERLAP